MDQDKQAIFKEALTKAAEDYAEHRVEQMKRDARMNFLAGVIWYIAHQRQESSSLKNNEPS